MARPKSSELSLPSELSLAESGALALAEAARDLDSASNAAGFLRALERNQRVWKAIKDLAARENWPAPNARLADYALSTARKMGGRGVNDEHVEALIDINRRVSAELARGDDIDHIRSRAYFIWESAGRPQGQDLEHWLLAEMELRGRGH